MISLEPPFWAQVMACFIVGIAIVLLPFARASVAIVLLTVALLAFLSAAHRITVDGRHAVLRDAYLFVPVTRARFDPVEGLAADYHYEAGDWIVTLKPRDGRQTAHLFLGVPPWRIDATPLSVFWPRTQSPG